MSDDFEAERLHALSRFDILDTPAEPEFDRITALAARLFRVPTAVITFVDRDRQWFKSRYGLELPQTTRDIAFCAVTISAPEVMVILDAALDPRFVANPLVTGPPHVRFYAGAPLRTADGYPLGTLALLDVRPHDAFGDTDRALLSSLAAIVVDELDLRLRSSRVSFGEADVRRLLMEQLPALVWTTDAALRVTSAQGAGLAAIDLTAREMVSAHVQDFARPGDMLLDPDEHRRALAGEPVATHHSWRGRALDVRIEPLRDVVGHVVGVVGLMLDVTVRHQMEVELRATQRRLEHLLTAGPAVIYSSTLVGRFGVTFMSDNIRELTGWEAREFIESPSFWIDHVHPDDVGRIAPALMAAIDGGVYVHDYRFLCRDGSYRHIHDELRVLRDEHGRPKETIGFWTDVTELKQSELALRDREQRYELIARAASDVIWDWDLSTGTVHWNDALYTAFRFERGAVELTADWWVDHIRAADRDAVVASIHRAIDGGELAWSAEYSFVRGDGTYAEVMDRGYILRGPDGKAVRLVGAMIDVTERNRMQQQLIQADRLASIGTLAAGVAHEINNPLAYIVANVAFAKAGVERLLTQTDGGPRPAALLAEVRDALSDAEQGGDRVRQIVRDLKLFSRGDDPRLTRVDMREVVTSALAMTMNEIRHCAQVVKEFEPVPAILTNEPKLAQVFVNLLVNAAQAIGEGHADRNEIRVVTGTDHRGWAFTEVRDSGPGIPAAVINRIFDPFFTTKPVGIGTGLGLSICHGIVASLGGEITVDSGRSDGARFRVSLRPAVDEATAAAAVVALDPAVTAGAPRKRILVVDDDESVARALARTLASEHDVVFRLGGRAALALLDEDDGFDVILCDLMMPDLSGMDVYELLAATRPLLARRVAFMTGGTFTLRALEFLARMDRPRFEKPFDMEALRVFLHSGSG